LVLPFVNSSLSVTMQFTLIAAIAGFAGAEDVTLDTGKLMNFYSAFSLSLKDAPYGPRQAILMNGDMEGQLELNLLDEKLEFSYKSKDVWQLNPDSPSGPPDGPLAMLIPGATRNFGQIVIDGRAGQATIKQKGRADTLSGVEMDMNYCFHVKLPAGLLPPAGLLKHDADQMFYRTEQGLNDFPHTELDNGDLYYSPTESQRAWQREHGYPQRQRHFSEDISMTIKSDGTPVSAHRSLTCDDVCMENGYMHVAKTELNLTVTAFSAGSGDMTPMSCADSSVADLSEHPGIMHAAVMFDTFMEQIAQSSGLKLPSLQPLIEQQMLLAENVNDQSAQQQSWMVALLAGVAGMAGGAVVLALAKVFRGQGRDPPLLSSA